MKQSRRQCHELHDLMFYKRDSFIAAITKTTDFMARPHGKKNCSSVCFLFLLLLFGELFKIQLLKLRISPSPSWSYNVASKNCNLWIMLSWNCVYLDIQPWNLAELYSRSRDPSHVAELYEAVARNSRWSAVWFQNNLICMNAVGGD